MGHPSLLFNFLHVLYQQNLRTLGAVKPEIDLIALRGVGNAALPRRFSAVVRACPSLRGFRKTRGAFFRLRAFAGEF
jgi:hypothetical protein